MSKINVRDKPIKEITLRRYEKPHSELDERTLVRKFCLSIGLLNPGDKRDVIVDILRALIHAKEPLSVSEIKEKIIELRKSENLELKGIAESNIRRQLRRLKELYLIDKIGGAYYISENDSFENIFEEKIKKFVIDHIVERVKEYAINLDLLKKKDEEK